MNLNYSIGLIERYLEILIEEKQQGAQQVLEHFLEVKEEFRKQEEMVERFKELQSKLKELNV